MSLKRIFDFVISVGIFFFIWPLCVAIAGLIYLSIGIPIFFRQMRPGRDGKPFVIYKFRTMSIIRDIDGSLLPDSQRITRLGRLLRATSLDELPELFNVLKGEMSLVGPRPLLMKYLRHYTPEQFRRHDVTPGITGLAQINGRNLLSWEDRFRLDLWYVDHVSFSLDLKIMIRTLAKILTREGIHQPGHVSMEEFEG